MLGCCMVEVLFMIIYFQEILEFCRAVCEVFFFLPASSRAWVVFPEYLKILRLENIFVRKP